MQDYKVKIISVIKSPDLSGLFHLAKANLVLTFTLGSLAGSVAGGVVAGQLPQFSGVKGGSLANGFAEIGHKSVSGAITGAVGGGVGALVDGENIEQGLMNGARNGAIGGGVQAGLNIATMGTTYVPENVEQYGDFGRYKPVYRRGTFLYGDGAGIALGRNLVTRLTGDAEYDRFLIAHETGHFVQQRQMGLEKMYGKTASDYLKYGHEYSYYRFGTLEMGANMYSYRRLGYYFSPNGRIRDFR